MITIENKKRTINIPITMLKCAKLTNGNYFAKSTDF